MNEVENQQTWNLDPIRSRSSIPLFALKTATVETSGHGHHSKVPGMKTALACDPHRRARRTRRRRNERSRRKTCARKRKTVPVFEKKYQPAKKHGSMMRLSPFSITVKYILLCYLSGAPVVWSILKMKA